MLFTADELYRELYPEAYAQKFCVKPITGYTLFEATIQPTDSNFAPNEIDLTTRLGNATLNVPLLSAAMDTVTGSAMARVMSLIGGCGIIYRTNDPLLQLAMINEAINTRSGIVSAPVQLQPGQTIETARALYNQYDFSTMPVVDKEGLLQGILFTKDITWDGHLDDKVADWMVPLSELKTVDPTTPFEVIHQRLRDEKKCTVLPLVHNDGKFGGMYFRKDFRVANPSWHWDSKLPLVGMAIGVSETDIVERVIPALEMGVGIIVIDSSHGSCKAVYEQVSRVKKICGDRAVVVGGNITDLQGFINLYEAGADVIKVGIGSGSICTTPEATGAAFPMHTALRHMRFAQLKLRERGLRAPEVIADGSIEGPGFASRALFAGAHAIMGGKWFVSAKESHSAISPNFPKREGKHYYRGMASKAAITNRVANRYGDQKSAEEGIEGFVLARGPMSSWVKDHLELIRGGFAHAGAKNIEELHILGDHPMAFVIFTAAGQQQNATRVEGMR